MLKDIVAPALCKARSQIELKYITRRAVNELRKLSLVDQKKIIRTMQEPIQRHRSKCMECNNTLFRVRVDEDLRIVFIYLQDNQPCVVFVGHHPEADAFVQREKKFDHLNMQNLIDIKELVAMVNKNDSMKTATNDTRQSSQTDGNSTDWDVTRRFNDALESVIKHILSASVEEWLSEVGKLTERISCQESRMQELVNHVASIQQSVDEIDGRVETMEKQLLVIDKKVAKRLDELNDLVTQQAQETARVQNDHNNKIGVLQNAAESIVEQVRTLRDELSHQQAQVTAVNKLMDTVRQDLENQQGQVLRIQDQLVRIDKAMNQADTAKQNLSQQIEAVETTVGHFTNLITSLSQQVACAVAWLEQLRNELHERKTQRSWKLRIQRTISAFINWWNRILRRL